MRLRNPLVSTLGLVALLSCSGAEPTAPNPPPTQQPPTQQQNYKPVITSTPVTQVNENSSYNYEIKATSPLPLAYEVSSPNWLNTASNIVFGKSPQVSKDSIVPVRVKVYNEKDSTIQNYNLTVKDIYKNAYVLTENQAKSITFVNDSTWSLPQSLTFSLDDIIASGPNSTFPKGALKKVTDVSQDNKTIKIRQGTLDEVISDASLSYTTELSPSQIQGFSGLPGVSMAPSMSNAFKFGVSLNNVVLYDRDENLTTKDDQIVANGSISFNTSFDFDLSIKKFKLEKFLFKNTTSDVFDMTIGSTLYGFSILRSIKIAEYNFPPLLIGYLPTPIPIPVIVTPSLVVEAGVHPSRTNPLSFGVKQEATLATKLNYENGWSASAEFSNDFFDLNIPSPKGEWNIVAWAGPTLELLLYDAAGPFAGVSGYLRLANKTGGSGDWRLYGGLNASAGAKIQVPVLGKGVTAFAKEVLHYEKLLAPSDTTVQPPSDTSRILFDAGNLYPESGPNIYTIKENGSDLRKITNCPTVCGSNPRASKDGNKIAFVSNMDGNLEIYAMNLDGSGLTRLTNTPSNYASKNDDLPDWSPDGSEIIFVSNRSQYTQNKSDELYIMGANGINQRKLNIPGLTFFAIPGEPKWSPDGGKIILSLYATDRGERDGIYIVNKDGTGLARLTYPRNSGRYGDIFPEFSPDGSKVIFESIMWEGTPNYREIYVIDSNGANERKLTTSTFINARPSWSPDGTRFVLISDRESQTDNIYIMESDGSTIRRLITGVNGYLGLPSYLPKR